MRLSNHRVLAEHIVDPVGEGDLLINFITLIVTDHDNVKNDHTYDNDDSGDDKR